MESSHTGAPKSPEHHFGLGLGSTLLNSGKNSTSIVNTKLAVVYMLSSGKTDGLVTPLSSMIQLSTQYQAAQVPPSPRTDYNTWAPISGRYFEDWELEDLSNMLARLENCTFNEQDADKVRWEGKSMPNTQWRQDIQLCVPKIRWTLGHGN